MLRTNLSTRPFYNIRAVQAVLGALAVAVVLMTLGNVFQLVRLSSSERALGARASQAEAEAARLRDEAQKIRAQINTKELGEVAAAAAEANAIIDLRAFSWSDLLAELEATLPENVRLRDFQPSLDREGRFVVSLRVQARRVPDLEAFLDGLEKTGMFRTVLAAEEQTNAEGLIDALVQGEYLQPSRAPQPPQTASGSQTRGAAGE